MHRFSPRSYTEFVPGKPRYAIRVEDIGPELILSAQCQRCKHVGDVDRGHMIARWGDRSFMAKLDDRLRCSQCGNRTYNAMVITGRLERWPY